MSTIAWGNKTIDVRSTFEGFPKAIKVNDYVVYRGELTKVVTIQRDCPSLERLANRFTMFTLKTSDDRIIPARNLVGKVVVIKEKKRYMS